MKYAEEDPEFVQLLAESLYVDDIVSGADNETAYELYIRTKSRLSEGGFNARQFKSNSDGLTERIDQNEKAVAENPLPESKPEDS